MPKDPSPIPSTRRIDVTEAELDALSADPCWCGEGDVSTPERWNDATDGAVYCWFIGRGRARIHLVERAGAGGRDVDLSAPGPSGAREGITEFYVQAEAGYNIRSVCLEFCQRRGYGKPVIDAGLQ